MRLAVLLLPCVVWAQYSGNIAGTVSDAAGRPLAGASVVVIGGESRKVKTDARGRFLLAGLPVAYPSSKYSVVASAAGKPAQVLKDVAVLPGAVMAVECRFVLGRTAALPVRFFYSHERAAAMGKVQAGKIFATREGLVGRTTANGHVIRAGDRFVALPSRRALNRRGEREFQVRVTHGSRSVVAPVWDIGPWNIKDDYWNSDRESWRDLERGLPEAQAAFLNGYNGGKDGFGRKVLNPAGIDLSDAVFWDGLGMRDNGWVTVEYLWDATLVSSREPVGRRTPAPAPPRRDRTRTVREIIALAEAVLIRSRW